MIPVNPAWEVSVTDVKAMLDDGSDFVLLDVRQPDEYAICKINGAQLVPLSDLERKLEDIRDIAGSRRIVTHCHHGGRSLKAASILRAAGLPHTHSMAGGIDAWSLQVDPSVARY